MLNVVLIGAGRGCCALLPILRSNKEVHLFGVADTNPSAPGLELARQWKIPVTQDYRKLITEDKVDVIIDVTASSSISSEIHRLKRPSVEVLGGQTAKLIWGIIDGWHQKADALQETKSYLQSVMDNAHDMIITTDLNDRVVSFNRGAEVVLGYSKQEFSGKPIYDLYVDKREREKLQELVAKEGSISNYETRLYRKDGTTVDIILTLSLLKDHKDHKGNNVIGTVGISKDITMLRKSEEEVKTKNRELLELNRELEKKIRERTRELERTNEGLKQADKRKSEFLSNMSHELITPLNSVLALSRILLGRMDGELTTEQEKQLLMIEQGGGRLHELIITLLDLSKIEAGKIEIYCEAVDLEVVVQSVITTIKPLLKSSQCVLKVEIKGGPLRLVSDRCKLEQIWLNLLSNAVKFTPEGGTIVVGAEMEGNKKHVSCFVKDAGVGISKEDQAFIFDKFRKVGASMPQHRGTGLGLSITKKLVQVLGGRIWVESALGQGAKFAFTLPLDPSGQSEESNHYPDRREPQDVSELDPLKRTILVVDDNEYTLCLLTNFLRQEGCEVITAKNGYEALQKARKFNPFAITLDVVLPGMDGWQVIQELKDDSRTEHIPTIIVSKLGKKELGLSLGRVDYLVKPFDPNRLVRRVTRLLGNEAGKDIVTVNFNATELNMLKNVLKTHSHNVWATSGTKNAVHLLKMYKADLVILNMLSPNGICWNTVLDMKRQSQKEQLPLLIATTKDLTKAERERVTGSFLRTFANELSEQSTILEEVHALLDRRAVRRLAKRSRG